MEGGTIVGLDMFVEAEYDVGGWRPPRGTKLDPGSKRFDDILTAVDVDPVKFRERYPSSNWLKVQFQVCYWRQAHTVHRWFVRHVQDGEDHCKRVHVRRDQLATLREECLRVLATVNKGTPVQVTSEWSDVKHDTYPGLTLNERLAHNLLPAPDGYNQWYVEQLEDTVEKVDAVLTDPLFNSSDLYYRASW